MSSLSINGLRQDLGQLFGGFSAASPPKSAASTSRTSGTASSTASAGTTGAAAPASAAQAGGHHRRHVSGGKQVQQIQDAVTSALQAAQSSGSSDPDKVIEDAIAKVFKQAGSVSPSSSTSSSTQQAGSTPEDDGDTDAADPTGAESIASQQAFFKTLQSLGVSPQQFKSDFLTAIQDVQQTGNVDVSAALKSLPKGSILDAIG